MLNTFYFLLLLLKSNSLQRMKTHFYATKPSIFFNTIPTKEKKLAFKKKKIKKKKQFDKQTK
jgi:hypothetical protein